MMQRPPFSWSKSRKEIFDKCQRQYWYQYYGYWNGWSIKSSLDTRAIYFLRNLVPLDAIVGVIVHEIIKDFLLHYKNTGEKLDLIDLYRGAELRFDKIKKNTYSKAYRNTKKTIAIQEFNYNELSDNMVMQAQEKIKACLANFYVYFDSLNIDSGKITLIDDEETGFVIAKIGHTELRIYAVIDFAYYVGDYFIITDWKTGHEIEGLDSAWLQLICYGLWANDVLSISYEKIKHKIVNVTTNQLFDYRFEEKDYNKAFEIINKSIIDMFELDGGWQESSRFYKTTDKKECNKCKFREVCLK